MSSASEQYQHEIASALAGIEGVENISDNIIVHGPDRKTYDSPDTHDTDTCKMAPVRAAVVAKCALLPK